MTQESMFWKLVPEGVIGMPAKFTNADFGLLWKVKKHNMEVAMGGTWTKFEWGPRPLQLGGYVPREFGALFVVDRPFAVRDVDT